MRLFAVFRHRQLANQQVAGALQHLLFPKGEGLGLIQNQQSFQDIGDFQQGAGPHALRIFLEAVFPVGIVVARSIFKKIHDLLDFSVLHHPPQTHSDDVVERHHHFEAAGLDLEQVEVFHTLADGAATDLLNNSNSMIGVDDLVAYMEIAIAI